MQHNTIAFQTVPACSDNLRNFFIKRIRKPHVRNGAAFKVRPWPHPLCPINYLVRHHEIPRRDLLL
jgi:hypothetical protein